MKREIIIGTIIFFAVLVILQAMTVHSEQNKIETENKPNAEGNRPYIIEDEIVLTADSDLSVIDKQISIHQYTEEDMQEQLYFDSLEMLAICVEAEAGNQDFLGKRLVVDVILNRVDSPDFPNDIVSVITQPNQFASYADGNMDKVYEPSEETFEAVRRELNKRTDSQILFFTEGNYNPYCTPAYQHGDHYFGY